jgi:hypothetical protein
MQGMVRRPCGGIAHAFFGILGKDREIQNRQPAHGSPNLPAAKHGTGGPPRTDRMQA